MIDQLRSELIKLRTVRSTVIMLGIVVLLSLVPAVLLSALVGKNDLLTTNELDRVSIVLIGAQLSQILVAVIAALVMAGEFRFGTIRTTFVAEPHRLRVLAAKAITVAVLAAVVATIMVAVASGVGGAIMRARDIGYPYGGEAWRLHYGVVLYSVFYAVIALAIATLVRNAAASIVLVIVVPLIVETIITAILTATKHESWARWLPFSAGGEISSAHTGESVVERLSPWTGYGYAWLWAAALLALGGLLLHRRDA